MMSDPGVPNAMALYGSIDLGILVSLSFAYWKGGTSPNQERRLSYIA
jgi:hypothetical protein